MITVTDLFCGAGGSSTGASQVPSVKVSFAANHEQTAIDVHHANHPDTDHAAVDLHEEDPKFFPRTTILWASPECTKWSQASGGRYSSVTEDGDDLLSLLDPEHIEEDPETAAVRRSRLLMFDVLRFAEHHRYRAMIIENVVDVAVSPRYATPWALWLKSLDRLGYCYRVVSLNSMHAQALGAPAPQSRDRIYIVCWLRGIRAPDIDRVMRPAAWCPRCERVVESQQAWKNGRKVGKYRAQYIYIHSACGTAVEPGWLPAAAAIDWTLPGTRIGDRARPLADKTRARIAAGIARYWRPFTLEAAGNTYERRPGVRTWPVEDPLRTLHASQSKAIAVPVEGRDGKTTRSCDEPWRTLTTRAETALVTGEPFVLERRGEYRTRGIDQPMSTVTANETTKALCHPPFMAEFRGGGSDARPVTEPLSTVTAGGNHHALVSPYYGRSPYAQPVDEPIGTLTTHDKYALIHRHNGTSPSGDAWATTPATEPLRTLTTKGHQSLITPGDLTAAEALVDDCLFRMLEPHEVAAGMAFPPDYQWQPDPTRPVSRRNLVKLAGNAVTPPAARDLIAAVVESLGGAA